MHDISIENTNREILKYIPYGDLFPRLEEFRTLKAKNSPTGMKLLDLPTILYIINTPDFEENEEYLIKNKDNPESILAFVRKHYSRINCNYDGGLLKLLNTGSKNTMPFSYCFAPSSGEKFNSFADKNVTVERLVPSNSIVEKLIDPETKEEYLLLKKVIKRTDSPRELDTNPRDREELLGKKNKDFFVNKKNATNIMSVTRRLFLYVLKNKVKLKDKEIFEWFTYYGFKEYPDYQYISQEISRHKDLFK